MFSEFPSLFHELIEYISENLDIRILLNHIILKRYYRNHPRSLKKKEFKKKGI